MFKEIKPRANRVMATALMLAAAGGFASSVVSDAQAQSRDLKMAFFASPKHPIWSKLMAP